MDAETRTYVKAAIDRAVRARLGKQTKRTRELDFEKEVDTAMAFYRSGKIRAEWPPHATVPSARGRAAYKLARAAA